MVDPKSGVFAQKTPPRAGLIRSGCASLPRDACPALLACLHLQGKPAFRVGG